MLPLEPIVYLKATEIQTWVDQAVEAGATVNKYIKILSPPL